MLGSRTDALHPVSVSGERNFSGQGDRFGQLGFIKWMDILIAIAAVVLFLAMLAVIAGCSPLGGIQPDLAAATQNAGVSCVRVKSLVMGDAVAIFVSDTHNAITNGVITVDPDTCRVTISNAQKDAP